MSKKKKILIIISAILAVILIALGILAYMFRDVIHIMLLDTEEVRKNVVENGQEFHSSIQERMGIVIDEFTEEELEQIASGEVSLSTILAEKIEDYIAENPTVEEDKENEIIIRYMRKFSTLQGQYMGTIDGIIAEARNEYHSGNISPGQKTEFANRYISRFRGAESSCDAEVESLLSQLKAELEAVGADTSIVNEIRQTYANEKAAKEVYYRDLLIN